MGYNIKSRRAAGGGVWLIKGQYVRNWLSLQKLYDGMRRENVW